MNLIKKYKETKFNNFTEEELLSLWQFTHDKVLHELNNFCKKKKLINNHGEHKDIIKKFVTADVKHVILNNLRIYFFNLYYIKSEKKYLKQAIKNNRKEDIKFYEKNLLKIEQELEKRKQKIIDVKSEIIIELIKDFEENSNGKVC